jgi:hypothetical protein
MNIDTIVCMDPRVIKYKPATFLGIKIIAKEYQGYSRTKVSFPEIVEYDRDPSISRRTPETKVR